jgi:D-lactate dehydrogenase
LNAIPRKVRRSLRHIFAADDLLLDTSDCLVYGYDNSRRQALPAAVCFAQEPEQIVALVQLCRTHQIPLIPRGAGTGTTGATVPEQGGIVLSTERFRRTLQIDPDNRLAVVSPGFTNQELQQQAAQHGFFWPPDPGSATVCTIGGNLAHNSAGPRAIKYGTPRDNTLGLRAVSGRGELLRTGVRTSKGVVGYDLTRLLIGSEGTLAITTEATLQLTPLPEAKCTLQAVYRSVTGAAQAVSALMAQPVTPCTLEFMDGQAIRMVRDYADLALPEDAAALLLIETDGTADAISQATQQVRRVAENADCTQILLAESATEVAHLWRARKALSPSLRHVARKKINEDVAVPVSHLPSLIDGLQHLSTEHGITIVNFGHAGNGNIHVNLLFDPDDPVQAAASQPCLLAVFELVLRLGGTLSGEHGVGRAKRPYVGQELDQHALALMRLIKHQFDPDGILNPGVSLPEIH